MKKTVKIFLCVALVVTGITGCGDGSKGDGTPQQETTATPTETAVETPEETPKETPTQTPDEIEETLVSPIEIDTSIPIEKGGRIAVVAKATTGGYWNSMRENMQEAVDYLNQAYQYTGEDEITMTFEGPKDEENVTDQINILDAVLSENPAVLCLAAIDVNSCEAQLETAQENGIPVVIFDSGVTSPLAATFVGTDNRKAGRRAADKLCKAIGDTGEVVVFAHENVSETSIERVQGFRKRIQNKHPKVILESINYANEEESSEDMIRRVLEEHNELKGIFCTNGPMAEVVLGILTDYPEQQVQVVGFDAGEIQKKAIIDGTEYGIVVQDTYRTAYETIWTAAKYAAEEEMREETEILVPFVWVDKENIEAEENTKILYD